MYVWSHIHIARVWINRVRLPILLVVSRTGKMNVSLFAFAPENLVTRDGKSDIYLQRNKSVCGTRSSMLAGLSCTKGVWYIYDWDTGSTILIW